MLKSIPLAFGLAATLATTPVLAEPAKPLGALGRWTLDLAESRFDEALTGDAPTAAELDVTKDDGAALAWTLVEEDAQGVAAIQFADAPLNGQVTRAVVNWAQVSIRVTRLGDHGVLVVTEGQSGRAQSMKVWMADPVTLRIEQDVDGLPGPPDQALTFRRIRSLRPAPYH
jgi:hypothetical protein